MAVHLLSKRASDMRVDQIAVEAAHLGFCDKGHIRSLVTSR
jgi:hypothetical protein